MYEILSPHLETSFTLDGLSTKYGTEIHNRIDLVEMIHKHPTASKINIHVDADRLIQTQLFAESIVTYLPLLMPLVIIFRAQIWKMLVH